MRLAILCAVIASFALVVQAADVGTKPDELYGDWQIAQGVFGDGEYTLTFAVEGKLTIKVGTGAGAKTANGPHWSYTEGRLSFDGMVKVAALKVTGTWVTDWSSADEILITQATGSQFKLKRLAPESK